jgi:hypothetical protein
MHGVHAGLLRYRTWNDEQFRYYQYCLMDWEKRCLLQERSSACSHFVWHAYFLGANDPYSALKTTLKAEINEEAWATLHSDTSRPFPKPKSGRIAVKVINHLGDEVMKVFRVG